MASDNCFGTCLIEKGSEVGGKDSRFSIGTLCEVKEVIELSKDNLFVTCIGIEKITVQEWLPEKYYPKAVIRSSAIDSSKKRDCERIIFRTIENTRSSISGADDGVVTTALQTLVSS